MAKPFLQLAALGVAGFAFWKVASLVLFPILGLVLKVVVIVGLVILAIWYLKRDDKPKDDTAG